MTSRLVEYFNKQPRLGSLSTSSREGKVNVAMFGSARMTDEKTVVIGLGNNRSLQYLSETARGLHDRGAWQVPFRVEGHKSLPRGQGDRQVRTCPGRTENQIAKVSGKEGAAMMSAVVTFRVVEVRPLIDTGQGWEKTI